MMTIDDLASSATYRWPHLRINLSHTIYAGQRPDPTEYFTLSLWQGDVMLASATTITAEGALADVQAQLAKKEAA